MTFKDDIVGKNIGTPVKKIKHSELIRCDDSPYRSLCPECHEGILLVRRNPDKKFELDAMDNCILCGQLFEYTDIEDLKKLG